jgi:hypothetical protein
MDIINLAAGWAAGVGIATVAALLIWVTMTAWRRRRGWRW